MRMTEECRNGDLLNIKLMSVCSVLGLLEWICVRVCFSCSREVS